MESRLRRLITIKRDKRSTQRNNSIDLQSSSSSRSGLAPWRRPSMGSRSSSTPNNNHKQDGCLLQAVPYDAVTAGKAPIFSSQPVRGNGPVKLQTSHRLSSGELRPTTQDNKTTLEDILEGEYIVAGKGSRNAHSRSIRHATPHLTPALSASPSCSESSGSPQTPSDTYTVPWIPSFDEHMEASIGQPGTGTGTGKDQRTSSNIDVPLQASFGRYINRESQSSYTSSCTAPSIQTVDEQNATVAALLKAEHNRLTDIYRREKPERRKPRSVRESGQRENGRSSTPLMQTSREHDRAFEMATDSLPCPSFIKSDAEAKRSSNTSAVSSQYHCTSSDVSSHERMSLTSSYAASSSHTAISSTTDYHDVTTTRDEIRKMVDEMRSTYIHALENHPPSTPKAKQKAKKRRHPKAGIVATGTRSKRSMATPERQPLYAHHSQIKSGSSQCEPGTRAMSQPVPRYGRLSPVEASPPQTEKTTNIRLQRADSSTLGSITSRMTSDHEKMSELRTHREYFNSSNDLTVEDNNRPDVHLLPPTRTQTLPEVYKTSPVGNFF